MSEQSSQPRKPGIFLSHSHADKPLVRRLAADLQSAGARVWLDEAEIKLGDSLIQRIQEGIDEMDYLAVVLSPKSVASDWVQREVEIALNEEIAGHRVKVLPLLQQSCNMPGFLRGKLYADFTSDDKYQGGLDLILDRLRLRAGTTSTTTGATGVQPQLPVVTPQIAPIPIAALTRQPDEATFETMALELLRANDDIALRMFINNSVLDAGRLIAEEGKRDDLLALLDRLACLVAITITFDRPKWRDEGIRALARIYSLGFNQYGQAKDLKCLNAPDLWLDVIERVMALGALCVRGCSWDGVRALVLRPRKDGDFERYASWLRHGLTMASRAGRFDDAGTSRGKPSLVALGRLQTDSHSCLRPDVGPEDEAVLDSLCQFDFLCGITAIGDTQIADSSAFYPSFALYYATRTEPAALSLITDSPIRKMLFPYDDSDLATALWAVIQEAGSLSFRFGVWDGFGDKRIAEFIRKHLPAKETP